MTAILGLNAFRPDSSACLVIDGKLVSAVAEERLGERSKHTKSFPVNAIKWNLENAGLRLRDISHVAIARSPSANLLAKISYTLRRPDIGINAVNSFLSRQHATTQTLKDLPKLLCEDSSKVKYSVHNIEHHLAHIASSYYLSSFDSAAGLSYDGSGDFASLMAAKCEGHKISVVDRVRLPHSLGHYYTAMCQFIGFDLFGEEYKVMGLAPYGSDIYSDQMHRIVDTRTNNWFKLNMKYFMTHRGLSEAQLNDSKEMKLGKLYSDNLIELLGRPRLRSEPITQRDMDIAKSTQCHFERAASNCIAKLESIIPINNFALSGGCAFNGVMNAKIYRDFKVDDMYLQCAAGDDGTAIGAAYSCWHSDLNKTERFHMQHAFWGPNYSTSQIRNAIEKYDYQYTECCGPQETIRITAKYIADGAVVGWYQGRSEWGPRALGNRSILANPAIPTMKDTINKKIKKRESFRPFAPSVLKEDVKLLFEQDIASPFMMHVVKFKSKYRDLFPAVTHVDGTGRLQTVEAENNKLYYDLIRELKTYTGYGIILNTSFNENEPVVDTPEQAISCFDRTDMDVLVMENFILKKRHFQ